LGRSFFQDRDYSTGANTETVAILTMMKAAVVKKELFEKSRRTSILNGSLTI
jgi:hypothetical protein